MAEWEWAPPAEWGQVGWEPAARSADLRAVSEAEFLQVELADLQVDPADPASAAGLPVELVVALQVDLVLLRAELAVPLQVVQAVLVPVLVDHAAVEKAPQAQAAEYPALLPAAAAHPDFLVAPALLAKKVVHPVPVKPLAVFPAQIQPQTWNHSIPSSLCHSISSHKWE